MPTVVCSSVERERAGQREGQREGERQREKTRVREVRTIIIYRR